MNASLCRYEEEVLKALGSGPLSRGLEAHVSGCAACSESMLVAQFFEREGDAMGEIPIPPAALVWRRALSRSRAEAAARATRPIAWVVCAGIAVMLLAAFWLLLGLPAWLGSVPASLYPSSLQVVGGLWVAVSLAAGAVTILTAVFGAVYILRVDRVLVALAKT